MATARAVPTPGRRVSVATGCAASRRSDPPPDASTSCPTRSAERPPLPVAITIATSSAELSDCAPRSLSRSRGRSVRGSSRILNALGFPRPAGRVMVEPSWGGVTPELPSPPLRLGIVVARPASRLLLVRVRVSNGNGKGSRG